MGGQRHAPAAFGTRLKERRKNYEHLPVHQGWVVSTHVSHSENPACDSRPSSRHSEMACIVVFSTSRKCPYNTLEQATATSFHVSELPNSHFWIILPSDSITHPRKRHSISPSGRFAARNGSFSLHNRRSPTWWPRYTYLPGIGTSVIQPASFLWLK
jgi:hypothetical protein